MGMRVASRTAGHAPASAGIATGWRAGHAFPHRRATRAWRDAAASHDRFRGL
jgi:hypothetical protein